MQKRGCWSLGSRLAGLPMSTHRRLERHGVTTTTQWAVGQSTSIVSGMPLLGFSRVSDHLYVGRQHGRLGLWQLSASGVHAIVNLRIEHDDAAVGLAAEQYCHLPTVDGDAPSMEHILEGVAFVRGVLDAGGKVFIHCEGGIGRAPTFAAACLVANGATPDDALRSIRRVRPFIDPTDVQLRRLDQVPAALRSMGSSA